MPKEPQIVSLSYQHRSRFFWLLALIFVVALPALIFYTTGYRLNFDNEETSIVTTGGMYITTDNLEVDVYLDDEQVERPRLFRSAYYIQNIQAGQHRVVVQRPDLHTWVKELPIDPYMVVEASAFNMPVVPHIRPISKYTTATGAPVYVGVSSTTVFFAGVTTTVPVILATSTATTTYKLNEEYSFVSSLFSTTSTSTRSVFERILDEVGRFSFATSSVPTSDLATTTEAVVERGGIRLVEKEGDLYAVWQGSINSVPYYFCVTDTKASTTAFRYGEHVALSIDQMKLSTTTPIIVNSNNRLCRSEIKIDRQRKDVYFYDFFPNSSDLILVQLEDGLYVTEIDDRAWQNSQLIYPGTDFRVVVENGAIFIYDNNRYFEIITKIEPI